MHRNTFLLMCILAVFAALLIGVNIGRSVPTNQPTTNNPQPTTVSASPTPTAATVYKRYTSQSCNVSFSYPETLKPLEADVGGTMFIDSTNPAVSIALACQKDIPRPPLVEEQIEQVKIGSISATLYHDASAKDGTPVDKLIFRHPKSKLDVYLSGFGEEFTKLISTVTIQ